MNKDKKQRLEEAVAAIRHAYGEEALRPLGDSRTKEAVPHISTGFASMDQALGIGGLPKEHLTQMAGIPTSGAMTLAWKVLAQAVNEAVVCIDLPGTFDMDYAARCGVAIDNLLLIQPGSLDQALET